VKQESQKKREERLRVGGNTIGEMSDIWPKTREIASVNDDPILPMWTHMETVIWREGQ